MRNIANPGGFTLVPATIGFTYLLFDFGGRDASIELARESLLAANWAHNAALQTVMLDAISAYYGFYPARKAAGLRPIEALRYQ